VLAFVCVWGVLSAVRAALAGRGLPGASGRCISALDFIDARGPTLRVRPLSSLTAPIRIEAHGHGIATLELRFQGGAREVFVVAGRRMAETVLDRLGAAHAAAWAAFNAGDADALGRLDPLFELRQLGWQVPRGPSIAFPLRRPWILAIAMGAVLAVPTWLGRTTLQDAKVSKRLRTASIGSLRDYIEEGGRQSDAARGLIHERFEKARRDFHAQAVDDPRLVAAIDAMLTWLEHHDVAEVPVRFRVGQSALADLDASLAATATPGMTIVPIAPHFTPEVSGPRENHVTSVLGQGLRVVIPADVFTLEHRGRVHDRAAEEPAAVERPEIEVSYTVLPSGSAYSSALARNRVFVGILVRFDVVLRVPGETEPFRASFEVRPPAKFEVQNTTGDASVYAVMAQRAFDELRQKLVVTFFRPGSAAHDEALRVIDAHEAERAKQDRGAGGGAPAPN
jgi:hypothetical protein